MNGKIYSINDKTFDKEVLQETFPVLVNYWTSCCELCQMISPVLEGIAEAYASHIKVAKLDANENTEIMKKYGVDSVPTLMLFRNGKIVATKVGSLDKGHLITFIEGNIMHKWALNYQ